MKTLRTVTSSEQAAKRLTKKAPEHMVEVAPKGFVKKVWTILKNFLYLINGRREELKIKAGGKYENGDRSRTSSKEANKGIQTKG